jgi:chemosensory pili system protein ChpA (sensor histidine kinase/response regulator)
MMPRRRVMLVEDDGSIREFLTFALESHGYEVAAARDGQEALDLLEETVPDVVLTDLEMPRLDGWQLISTLRFDPVVNQIPVIVISAAVGPLSQDDLGVRAVIEKPFLVEKLIHLLETIVL